MKDRKTRVVDLAQTVRCINVGSPNIVGSLFLSWTLHYVWFSWFWSHFFLHKCVFCTFENVKKYLLGGCRITSKAKINVYWNFFFTPGSLRGDPSLENFSKNVDWRWMVYCPAKMGFFPRFSSLCTRRIWSKTARVIHVLLLLLFMATLYTFPLLSNSPPPPSAEQR